MIVGLGIGVDPPGGALGGSTSRARDQDGLDYSQGAPWMRSSSDSRQHWRARQLAAVEMGQTQPQPRQQRSLPLNDTLDACSPQPDTPAPAWAPVWSRIHSLRMRPTLFVNGSPPPQKKKKKKKITQPGAQQAAQTDSLADTPRRHMVWSFQGLHRPLQAAAQPMTVLLAQPGGGGNGSSLPTPSLSGSA